MNYPTFNSRVRVDTLYIRTCCRCRKRIGKRPLSYVYGSRNQLHVCPACHRKCAKPGCEHRVYGGSRARPTE